VIKNNQTKNRISTKFKKIYREYNDNINDIILHNLTERQEILLNRLKTI